MRLVNILDIVQQVLDGEAADDGEELVEVIFWVDEHQGLQEDVGSCGGLHLPILNDEDFVFFYLDVLVQEINYDLLSGELVHGPSEKALFEQERLDLGGLVRDEV